MRRAGQPAALTARQAAALDVLRASPQPLDSSAIAAALGLRGSAVCVTLRSLQRRGLIRAAARPAASWRLTDEPGWERT